MLSHFFRAQVIEIPEVLRTMVVDHLNTASGDDLALLVKDLELYSISDLTSAREYVSETDIADVRRNLAERIKGDTLFWKTFGKEVFRELKQEAEKATGSEKEKIVEHVEDVRDFLEEQGLRVMI